MHLEYKSPKSIVTILLKCFNFPVFRLLNCQSTNTNVFHIVCRNSISAEMFLFDFWWNTKSPNITSLNVKLSLSFYLSIFLLLNVDFKLNTKKYWQLIWDEVLIHFTITKCNAFSFENWIMYFKICGLFNAAHRLKI